MPANVGSIPYVLPADHPLEYPALSQQLATAVDGRVSVMAASGTKASPVTPQALDLTTLQGSDGTLFTHNGTGIVCNFTGLTQVSGRFRFSFSGGGYTLPVGVHFAVTPGNIIKAQASWSSTLMSAIVLLGATPWSACDEVMASVPTITSVTVELVVRSIL